MAFDEQKMEDSGGWDYSVRNLRHCESCQEWSRVREEGTDNWFCTIHESPD